MDGANPSPRDLAELTLARLNRALTDLGITLRGGPVFVIDSFVLKAVPEAGLDEDTEIFDLFIADAEWEDYANLASALEKLGEKLLPSTKGLRRLAQVEGQQQLPGFED